MGKRDMTLQYNTCKHTKNRFIILKMFEYITIKSFFCKTHYNDLDTDDTDKAER